MQLEKAGTGGLIFSMTSSVLIAMACFGLAILVKDSFIFYPLVYIVLGCYKMITAYVAYELDDATGPLAMVSRQGLVLNSALSNGDPIPFEEIKAIKVNRWRFNYVIPVPFSGGMTIRVRDRSHVPKAQMFLPFGWFGIIRIPASYARGGMAAMTEFAATVKAITLDMELGGKDSRNPVTDFATIRSTPQSEDRDPIADYIKSRDAAEVPAMAAQPAPVMARTYASEAYPVMAGTGTSSSTPLLNGQPIPRSNAPRGFGRKIV